jgi:hypothetical protein
MDVLLGTQNNAKGAKRAKTCCGIERSLKRQRPVVEKTNKIHMIKEKTTEITEINH